MGLPSVTPVRGLVFTIMQEWLLLWFLLMVIADVPCNFK